MRRHILSRRLSVTSIPGTISAFHRPKLKLVQAIWTWHRTSSHGHTGHSRARKNTIHKATDGHKLLRSEGEARARLGRRITDLTLTQGTKVHILPSSSSSGSVAANPVSRNAT